MESQPQSNIPQQSDARGLLIPDDLLIHQDYIKSNPTVFFNSYPFYIKATKNTYRNPKTDTSVLKYLAAIPDQYFRLIKTLTVDFGFYEPDELDYSEYMERIIGDILVRAGKDMVIRIQHCQFEKHPRMQSLKLDICYEDRERYLSVCGEGDKEVFWKCLKESFRNQGYVNCIKIVAVKKWRFDLDPAVQVLEDIPDDISEVSCGTMEEDGTCWDYKLLDEYENRIFQIDPIERVFVWDVWGPIIQYGGWRLVEWLAEEVKDEKPAYLQDGYNGYVPPLKNEIPAVYGLFDVVPEGGNSLTDAVEY